MEQNPIGADVEYSKMNAELKQTTDTGFWTQWPGLLVNGTYPLRRLLGSSHRGAVFLTEHKAKNLPDAAIKFVQVDARQADPLLEQWAGAATLDHPNLVRLFETGRYRFAEQEFVYVVMEYADQTLAEILHRRALHPDEMLEMLAPTLEAMTFLHRRHLVHLQLKPSNVLAVGDQLKLASDTIRPLGQRSVGVTIAYDPPELKDHGITTAGDVWSLGATLVEALTQRTPSGSDLRFEQDFPVSVPASLKDTVRRCLSLMHTDRPSVIELRSEYKTGSAAVAEVRPQPSAASQTLQSPIQPAPQVQLQAPIQSAPSQPALPIQPQPSLHVQLRERMISQPSEAKSEPRPASPPLAPQPQPSLQVKFRPRVPTQPAQPQGQIQLQPFQAQPQVQAQPAQSHPPTQPPTPQAQPQLQSQPRPPIQAQPVQTQPQVEAQPRPQIQTPPAQPQAQIQPQSLQAQPQLQSQPRPQVQQQPAQLHPQVQPPTPQAQPPLQSQARPPIEAQAPQVQTQPRPPIQAQAQLAQPQPQVQAQPRPQIQTPPAQPQAQAQPQSLQAQLQLQGQPRPQVQQQPAQSHPQVQPPTPQAQAQPQSPQVQPHMQSQPRPQAPMQPAQPHLQVQPPAAQAQPQLQSQARPPIQTQAQPAQQQPQVQAPKAPEHELRAAEPQTQLRRPPRLKAAAEEPVDSLLEAAPTGTSAKRMLLLVVVAAVLAISIWAWLDFRSQYTAPVASQPIASTPIPAAPEPVIEAETDETEASSQAAIPAEQPPEAANGVLQEVIPKVPNSIQSKIQGNIYVTVRVLVAPAGDVVAVLMERPGPSKYFARLADNAARDWKFAPTEDEAERVWRLNYLFTRDDVTVHATKQ